jgi:hypothetical protein
MFEEINRNNLYQDEVILMRNVPKLFAVVGVIASLFSTVTASAAIKFLELEKYGDWVYSKQVGYCELFTISTNLDTRFYISIEAEAVTGENFWYESKNIDQTKTATITLSATDGANKKINLQMIPLPETMPQDLNTFFSDDYENLILPAFKGKWTTASFENKTRNGKDKVTTISLVGFSKAFKSFQSCQKQIN